MKKDYISLARISETHAASVDILQEILHDEYWRDGLEKRVILKARSTIKTDKKCKTMNKGRINIKIIENFLSLQSQYLIKAFLCSNDKVGVTKILWVSEFAQ